MQVLEEKKYTDSSWDFTEANTKTLTHCFHAYPAMMIPQIASRLIEKYGTKAQLLFDPYCGTGTSLVEANVHGIDAVGTDLNPLARLIAKAKTTPIPLEILDHYIQEFNTMLLAIKFGRNGEPSVELPNFQNIDFWFTKEVQIKLARLKAFIDAIDDASVRRFFYVAFSETVRESSLTRNSEFKLYRLPEKKRENFNPDVYGIMEQKIIRNRKGLMEFMRRRTKPVEARIFSFNTVHGIPKEILPDASVDMILTSPPYGDSRTTVAYGQFSRLANQWLGFHEASKLDKELMGGRPLDLNGRFGIDVLDAVLDEIKARDEKRVKDVHAFYREYLQSIDNISNTLRPGGYACFVVGNRRVKSVTLPTDEITVALFARNGFEHVETIVRRIPNKRMPSQNSPTNEVGKKDSTMNFEYIVVMQKK